MSFHDARSRVRALTFAAILGASMIGVSSPTLAHIGVLNALSRVTPKCEGQPATIIGTKGDDTIDGTAGNDVIVGGRRSDPRTRR